MINPSDMTDEEVRTRGLEALLRELGPAGLVRFLRQFETGHGDYTAERRKWADHLTLDELLRELQKRT